ncbi:MAG: RNA methyltransferase [Clostridia bacterium]|nr:RNA methyltransferase [Clostridia bacterium]
MDGYITSRQNQKILEACALSQKKYREEKGLFCFEGKKLLWEAAARGVPLTAVFLREDLTAEEVLPRALPAGCAVYSVSEGVYDKISLEKSPEGVFCIAKTLDKFHKFATIYYNRDFFEADAPTLLFAVSVRDPGNLGSIIRSAAAFSCGGLILSDDCADLYAPRTVRASMGTMFDFPVLTVSDVRASVEALKKDGIRVYAGALDRTAVALPDLPRGERVCALIGNEGHGLSADVTAVCDGKLFIPMSARAESLNASIAASVILYDRSIRIKG